MGWQDDRVIGGGGSNAWQNDQKAPFIQRAGRYARGLIDEAANFGTGLSDEFGAAVDATIPTQFLYPTSQADSWSKRYEENLKGERGRMKQFRDENPVAATAADVGGAIVGTTAVLPARLTSMGPSLIGNSLKMGATGAGLGAVSGFGQGEGGFEERAGSAVLPAILGGGLGVMLPVAGAAGRSIMESAPGRAVSKGVLDSAVAQRLATALQRGKIDPAQAGSRLDDLGEMAMLADVDTQTAKIARTTRSMPGATASHADTVLDARQAQMPGMVRRAFEGETPPPATFALRGEGQAFDQNARAVGQQAYGAMAGDKLKISGEMQKIMEEAPAIGAALQQIQQEAAETGTKLSAIQIADRVKQTLNRNADAAFASGKAVNKADIGALADRFEGAFFRANPSAQQAAASYAQAKSLPEFFDQGYSAFASGTGEKAMNASAPALADALLGANAQQVAATRAGTTNVVRDLTSGRNAVSQTRGIARDLPSEGIAARLGEIYEPGQAAAIQRSGDAVRTFDKTDKFVRGGSQTLDKALDVVDDANNIQLRAGSGGFGARIWDTGERLVNRLLAPNEAVRDALGKAMLNPNSAENKKILALAAELLKQRAAGSPIQAGLIEGLAGQAGGQ